MEVSSSVDEKSEVQVFNEQTNYVSKRKIITVGYQIPKKIPTCYGIYHPFAHAD